MRGRDNTEPGSSATPHLDLLATHYRGDPANHAVTPSKTAKKAGWGSKVFLSVVALVGAGGFGAWAGPGTIQYVSDISQNYKLRAPASSRAVFETVAGYRTVAPYIDSQSSDISRSILDRQDAGLRVFQTDVSQQDISAARKASSNEAKRLVAQMEMRQNVQKIKDPLAKLFAVQIYNNFTIKYDSQRSKEDRIDQRPTYSPLDTYKKGSGICEDWSVATYRSVIASGFHPDHVKVLRMILDLKDGTTDGHAVVDVNIAGQNYIMTVGNPGIVRADTFFAPKSPNLPAVKSIVLIDAVGADGVQIYSQKQAEPIKTYKSIQDGIVDIHTFSAADRAIIYDIGTDALGIAALPVYMTAKPGLAVSPKSPPPFRR